MKSSAVAAGDTATAAQYNNLRQDASASSFLYPSAQSSPNMTIKIEAGLGFIGQTKVEYAGGNSPTMTAPTVNPRIDLVYIDSAGTITIANGAEAASPSAPALVNNTIPICYIYHRTTATGIYDTDTAGQSYIYKDLRAFLTNPAVVQGGSNMQIFEAVGAGTWNKPTGTGANSVVIVEVWGSGGGGGNGANATGGGGGGGGAYFKKVFKASELGSTESISVAQGGGGGSTNGAAGNNGASSTFGSGATLVTGYGGGRGREGVADGQGGGGGMYGAGEGGGVGGSGIGGNGGLGGAPNIPNNATFTHPSGYGLGANAGNGMNAGNSTTGGGGGADSTQTPGSSVFGGGGGGASGNGGVSVYGGGCGGGAGATTVSTCLGGVSPFGGKGGNAGNGTIAAEDGQQPGGGGGGSRGNSAGSRAGNGGNGKVVVTTIF